MLKFKRLACGIEDVTQYSTQYSYCTSFVDELWYGDQCIAQSLV